MEVFFSRTMIGMGKFGFLIEAIVGTTAMQRIRNRRRIVGPIHPARHNGRDEGRGIKG